MFVAIFVASLIVAVMFHEFGHFATAKAFGMKVEKFFFGFGPTLWSFRRGETEYGVKAIPAGGFVKIVGMSAFEDVPPEAAGRTFHEQAAWKRLIVLAAGSFTHFVAAVAILFVALAFVGLPFASNAVEQVSEDSPAAVAGLLPGDEILSVDGAPTGDFDAVRDAIVPRPGDEVRLTIERAGVRQEIEVVLADTAPDGSRRGFLGVAPTPRTERLPVFEALGATVVGDFSVVRLTQLTISGLAEALSPSGISEWLGAVGSDEPRSPEGPISVVGIGQAVDALGRSGDFFAVLAILAQLNIVLGVLNMLPLPPLDGGHVAVLAVEETVNGVRRRRGRAGQWRLDPSVITPVALAVILLFTMLTLTAVYVDIVSPASELLQ